MSKVRKYASAAWRDSRPAVYAFLFAFGTSAYSFIHAHGFPKTHADLTVLLWSLGGIAFAAFVRAADPYIAKIVVAGSKVAFGGAVVLNQDDIKKLVQAELAATQDRIDAEARKAVFAPPSAPPAPAPDPVAAPPVAP